MCFSVFQLSHVQKIESKILPYNTPIFPILDVLGLFEKSQVYTEVLVRGIFIINFIVLTFRCGIEKSQPICIANIIVLISGLRRRIIVNYLTKYVTNQLLWAHVFSYSGVLEMKIKKRLIRKMYIT